MDIMENVIPLCQEQFFWPKVKYPTHAARWVSFKLHHLLKTFGPNNFSMKKSFHDFFHIFKNFPKFLWKNQVYHHFDGLHTMTSTPLMSEDHNTPVFGICNTYRRIFFKNRQDR